MFDINYNSKSDRRESKRKNNDKKWIKHNIGEWGKIHGTNASKYQKKKIKVQIKNK